ncbi:ATP-binding protein [Campylobacter sp. MIT 99-7217]|uniref:ATP-binding protein n=1 Tax=Campylobacter sp. MIT 99-7217 TaxID=535091 RepID=UPI00115AF3EB|nr:ATP-binding protein [Campylobacter sp. MIT 99-7217]TQR30614.1 ATP-binding protein [Campylobacter sp. MIT 99-7217]
MNFIKLKSQILAYESILAALNSNKRLILLIGKSGSGKSFLLEFLAKKHNFLLLNEPFFEEKTFLASLYKKAFHEDKILDFQSLFDILRSKKEDKFIFLLDEVGMYDECLLEKIRILSDLHNVYFVLSLHKKQALFEEMHLKSRLGIELRLGDLSLEELRIYIEQKHEISGFKKAHLKWLDRVCFSNLRSLDKIFETFLKLETFYQKENIIKKHKELLELCALHHNLLG